MDNMIEVFFHPRSIAVVGASRKRGTIGGEIFHNLVSRGFDGPVYPVNLVAPVVQSVAAYPRIENVPGDVDLAVVVVPKSEVLATVRACAKKNVRVLLVISAGFGETGADGRREQDELTALVRASNMRMVGPNCLGLLDTRSLVNATFAPTWPPSGNVAFASQSGALGLAILDYASALGIGISQFVSIGNKADVSSNDLLEYWERDDNTAVILLYLESLGQPTRFHTIASRVARKKPIVVVKSGRSEAGARAASSHTGALAGLDVAVDALLGQSGVIRTDTMEELFDMAMFLAHQPVPRGNRVAVLTNAGGPAIMCSDACESRGLKLPSLAPQTISALREFLPREASTANPVDMIASASADSFEKALKLLLADDAVDAVIVLFVPPIVTDANDVAHAILRGAANADRPVLTCFMGTHGIPPALASLRDGKVPSFAFPEAAAIALSRAVRYGHWLARPEGRLVEFSDISPTRAREAIGIGRERWLDPKQVREVFDAFGIPTLPSELASSADDAVKAAERIGYPVALKLASQTITHKSDVGGVVLGLTGATAVTRAFVDIATRLDKVGKLAEMQGVLVQKMAPGGVEMFVGVTQDPQFGPLIGFGTGGVNVELWRDIVFRVHPITDVDAREMIEQIRGVKLLDGFRGALPADREAIISVLLRVNRLLTELPEVIELDINPLAVLSPGHGAVAIDARMRVKG